MAQITQILLFSGILLLKRWKIIVWKINLPSNKSCWWSFRYVSSLSKKIFFRAPVKCFSLYGSNYSDSGPFKNVAFGDIQDHSLKKAHFKKKIAVEVSTMCLPSVKRYFHECQWSAFLFLAQIIQILLFSSMQLLERPKIIVW